MWSPSSEAMMTEFSRPAGTKKEGAGQKKPSTSQKGEIRQGSSYKNEVDW